MRKSLLALPLVLVGCTDSYPGSNWSLYTNPVGWVVLASGVMQPHAPAVCLSGPGYPPDTPERTEACNTALAANMPTAWAGQTTLPHGPIATPAQQECSMLGMEAYTNFLTERAWEAQGQTPSEAVGITAYKPSDLYLQQLAAAAPGGMTAQEFSQAVRDRCNANMAVPRSW
jgi:hypothetical protein